METFRWRRLRACCCTSTRKAAVPRRLLPRCCAGSDWSPTRTRICRSRSERDGESAIAGPDQALRDRLASFVSLKGLPRLPVDVARNINDREAAVMFGPVEHVFAVEERDIAGPGGELRVRIYRPDGGVRLPVLVYFHGGGWVVGGLDSRDGLRARAPGRARWRLFPARGWRRQCRRQPGGSGGDACARRAPALEAATAGLPGARLRGPRGG